MFHILSQRPKNTVLVVSYGSSFSRVCTDLACTYTNGHMWIFSNTYSGHCLRGCVGSNGEYYEKPCHLVSGFKLHTYLQAYSCAAGIMYLSLIVCEEVFIWTVIHIIHMHMVAQNQMRLFIWIVQTNCCQEFCSVTLYRAILLAY
jgi:hypothetical protein